MLYFLSGSLVGFLCAIGCVWFTLYILAGEAR
jgi:hypothetical protein